MKKKRDEKKNWWIQKKVSDSRAWNSRVCRTGSQSKIGKIFANEKILEKYSAKIYKIDPYFVSITKKKYKLIKIGRNTYYLELMFILLNIF